MNDYFDDDCLEVHNALLERFRAKRRELHEAAKSVHLYALLDQGALTAAERRAVGDLKGLRAVSLYAGSGLDSLEAVGPVLLAMPDVRNIEPLTHFSSADDDPAADRFLRLLSLAEGHVARVTWLWSPHDPCALVEHLQTLLHARLAADDEDAWFFFYYPSHLRVHHEQLPEATRRYMFGPVHAWWMLDWHGELVELAGEGLPVPRAWDVLPVPADVAAALQRAAMPAQVHAWLQQTRMNQPGALSYNRQLMEIAPLVERAQRHGLNRLADLAAFVAYGLRYRVDYDKQPQIALALADTASRGDSLVLAYQRVEADIWRELARSAEERVQARAERERGDKLKHVEHIRLSVRVVNASGKRLEFVYFVRDGKCRDDRQYIGSVPVELSEDVVVRKDDLLSPLPGARLVLSWDEIAFLPNGTGYRTPCEREVIIEGEVPLDENSGVLEIRFEKDRQRVVMHRDTSPWRDVARSSSWQR
ncbi:DUF4123 domain-containing protein [Burkholderia sp. WSM2232]|uniref:DUF4123 domain-containing protein n=1 Tax=Burkholderia sp. WSM2232 TaxID=944436 RepID=UPI0003FD988E|nr:DUF4123 domain-containing protein [Burkholderia sp. WSM2232]